MLRREPVNNLEQDAARHGLQRRRDGYSVVALLRERQIFRHVLVGMVQKIVGTDVSAKEFERGRDLIVDTVDRSMNASVWHYTLDAEEERNSAQDEARELHQQRDRFLVTLSHELRNQGSPILLGARLLKKLTPSNQQTEKIADRIERQARRQAILIDDLLDISRFRYGRLQLTRETLDLGQPVQHAVETFENDFSAKQLKIEVELPEQSLFASADETRITQILLNLLSNAIKFTPPGGTISVELGEEGESSALLTVRDSGVGISPEILPQLFSMFFQAEEPSKTVKTGLGVGLALAKILVEMHGGTIEAYSAGEGTGAEFAMRLPLAGSTPKEKSLSDSRMVLVVDDNPDHLELLADVLKTHVYQVIEARDASEALYLISNCKPHACVIDIGLPDMNGYQLARKLREIPQTRESRLVAITGYGTVADKHAFEKAGFDYYLPKPPNIEELNRILSER